jgi:predicted aconitase with swiveling domain
MREFAVAVVVDGAADAPARVLDEPVSFWGGIDPHTGEIVDVHHAQFGSSVAGTVLVMPLGRGSSSTSSVIAEMVRLGTAPAAFVLAERDEIVALGCLVGDELYGRTTPIVVASADVTSAIADGDQVAIDGGRLRFA